MPHRVLAVAGPALAHLTRVLSVLEVLREQECETFVATDGTWWLPLLHARGYQVEALPLMTSAAGLRSGSLALPMAQIRAAVAQDIAVLQHLRPHLVLLDWRHSMRLAAAICGIPVVAIANAHVTRHYTAPLAAPAHHPITRLFGARVATWVTPYVAPVLYRRWSRPYQQVARAYGHPGWPDVRDYVTGDATLYADLPSFAPTTPGSGHYIGPLIDYPLPTPALPTLRDPVLYITFGSEESARFAPHLIATVRDWPGSVVFSQGGHAGDWPERWLCAPYINPFALYQQARRVAWLFHGGNGSTYQLVRAWTQHTAQCVGAIAMPLHAEQQWNADKLAAVGGLVATGTIAQMVPTVRDVLHGMHDARMAPPPAALGHESAAYGDAPRRAAQEVRRWLP